MRGLQRNPNQDLLQWIRWNSEPDVSTGCRIWNKAHSRNGYGQIRVGGKNVYAHRIVFEAAYGALKVGEEVCHRCDNPRCVNAEHLFRGTRSDNMRDMFNKGRGRTGSKAPNAKLTIEIVRAIRRSTETNRVLAQRYGVNLHYVWRIRTQGKWRAWKHDT